MRNPNVISGIGRHVFPSGNIYEGLYLNDKRTGFGRLIWSDGAYYMGEWQLDKRSGTGCFFHANGTAQEGQWEDGKLLEEDFPDDDVDEVHIQGDEDDYLCDQSESKTSSDIRKMKRD